MEEKKSHSWGYALAVGSWTSTFALAWLMILEVVTMWPPGAFLAFFFLVAAMTSVILWSPAASKEK